MWQDGDGGDGGVLIYTADEILLLGLQLVGFRADRLARAKHKETNEQRFKAHFGTIPVVCAFLWEDVQRVEEDDDDGGRAHTWPPQHSVRYFLMALHHLKRYPTETEREAMFNISPKWGRKWCWYYVEKIQALKEKKITWPDFGSDIWCVSVDGTHCWIQEPRHPTWSMDTRYYSHKYGKAGLNYELGISLSESKLVWMNGPFRAGTNDKSVFKDKGFKQKLRAIGKKAIGDLGYVGHPNEVSIPNPQDSKKVKKFKTRALKRHEKFNGLTKEFDCLSGRFRHSVERFTNCFEAICVICQYRIEMEDPLYTILVDGVFLQEDDAEDSGDDVGAEYEWV